MPGRTALGVIDLVFFALAVTAVINITPVIVIPARTRIPRSWKSCIAIERDFAHRHSGRMFHEY
jgi:hypothetical protein